jgi:hypothetical protein
MEVCKIKYTVGNATPIIIDKLYCTKGKRDIELSFEMGEYHFYKDGAFEKFVAVTNNCSGVKKIIFPIIEFDSITINGNGATFVLHDITSPFYIFKSKNTTIKNIVFDRAFSPIINMRVKKKDENGFLLEIDKTKSPYYVKDGNVVFEREWGELSTAQKKLDLNLKGQHLVQYLFAGNTSDSMENLPASFMLTDAIEVEDGVYFKYRENTNSKCAYDEGAEIYCLADGAGRESDVILISDSNNVKIEDITIRRGLGMGIIGQVSSNIEINGIKTDRDYYKEDSTLTADCMHFVNCSGSVNIHNCDIEYISDDVINIHGIYTALKEITEKSLLVELKHKDQRFFNPYKTKDILDIINDKTFEVVSRFIVENTELASEDGYLIKINGYFINGFSDVEEGFLVENSQRMPNVNIYDNKFSFFPSMRVSGGGRIVIKENELSHCGCALRVVDLVGFWMESGRINEFLFTKNRLKNCTVSGKGSFIIIGIQNVEDNEAPKVHGRIEITENLFYGIKDMAIKAGGVKDLIIENNMYDTEMEDIISVDGIIKRR